MSCSCEEHPLLYGVATRISTYLSTHSVRIRVIEKHSPQRRQWTHSRRHLGSPLGSFADVVHGMSDFVSQDERQFTVAAHKVRHHGGHADDRIAHVHGLMVGVDFV